MFTDKRNSENVPLNLSNDQAATSSKCYPKFKIFTRLTNNNVVVTFTNVDITMSINFKLFIM